MITIVLAAVLWSAVGGRIGLKHAREDARRSAAACVGYGMLVGAVFGALLGSFWVLIAS
jgi:hypothetical protein